MPFSRDDTPDESVDIVALRRQLQRHEPPAIVDATARRVIGAAIEVHRHLGPGFLENTYEDSLVHELELRGLDVTRQVPIVMTYKDRSVATARVDVLVEKHLIVELKSVESITTIHVAQLLAYLRAAKLSLGLLINFNVPMLKSGIRRVVNGDL